MIDEQPSHAERVAALVPDDCKVVALLHDAIEDGHVSAEAAQMSLGRVDWLALQALTRRPHDGLTYQGYIHYLAMYGRYENSPKVQIEAGRKARLVKISDLKDNLHGRPTPPTPSLQVRYAMALGVLQAADV